ncbi:MAG: ATP-binding protein [Deltaproteobacteria bacterium]|jgi:MinD superfamily P-loop ATPase|nr:ATP-binding protein [Deltaproteobacteria bacterium]
MKEIVVVSGKGGTGKTSVTASLAFLSSEAITLADCDVDAANLHLLFGIEYDEGEEFYSGQLAEIDQNECLNCGRCKTVCHFGAITETDGQHVIDQIDCEGCGYCARICPQAAINMKDNMAGKIYDSTTRFNTSMVHARLGIVAENSGKLVARVKEKAREVATRNNSDYVLVDGSPGIGCPVVSSLSGADYVLIITEPTVSGIHDLERVYEVVKQFDLETGVVINKNDLNISKSNEIKAYLQKNNVELLAKLPWHREFSESLAQGKIVGEKKNSMLKPIFIELWKKFKELI